MKVLFVGPSGLQKADAVRNLTRAAEARYTGTQIFCCHLDPLLYGDGRNAATFLKMPPDIQRRRWRDAFRDACRDYDASGAEHYFLILHLVYHHRQIPTCVADFAALADWEPDRIVTFLDDVYFMRERIHQKKYEDFTLSELLSWRAEELMVADLFARTVHPETPPLNYFVPVQHCPDMLARLLLAPTEEPPVRIYTSYNISAARDTKKRSEERERIRQITDDFRKRCREEAQCVFFDPLTIDELPPLLRPHTRRHLSYDRTNLAHRWPVLLPAILSPDDLPIPHKKHKIPPAELRLAKAPIEGQIEQRDYRLIDQSHYLLLYRPTLHGTPSLSSGVALELGHATNTGAPVIWYVHDDDPTPVHPFYYPDSAHSLRGPEENLWNHLAGLAPVGARNNFMHYLS